MGTTFRNLMQSLVSFLPSITVACRRLSTGSIFILVQFDKRSVVFQTIISGGCTTLNFIAFVTQSVRNSSSEILILIVSLIVPAHLTQLPSCTFMLTSFTAIPLFL